MSSGRPTSVGGSDSGGSDSFYDYAGGGGFRGSDSGSEVGPPLEFLSFTPTYTETDKGEIWSCGPCMLFIGSLAGNEKRKNHQALRNL